MGAELRTVLTLHSRETLPCAATLHEFRSWDRSTARPGPGGGSAVGCHSETLCTLKPTHSLCPQGGTEDRGQSLTNHEQIPVMMLLQCLWFNFMPSSLTEKYISSLKFTVVKTTLGIPYYKGRVYSPTESLGSLFIQQKNGRTLKQSPPAQHNCPDEPMCVQLPGLNSNRLFWCSKRHLKIRKQLY